jgi:hypothetical protein
MVAAFTGPVYAQTSGRTVPGALERAAAAWDNADYDLVPGLYEKALEGGNLARAEVVGAYARTGAAFAVTGKTRKALAALRTAALLDPAFTLPSEAGKKAAALAERARREQARVGSLTVTADAADPVEPGKSFAVEVTLAPPGVTLVDAVGIEVRDALAPRRYEMQATASARTRFDVPVRMALPDASLLVRVRARDAHGNELAMTERRVHVTSGKPVAVTPRVAPGRIALGGDHAEHPSSSSGGFWHSPWPYVLGGVTLAAGGAALYFATRPTADVNVGSARVELVP